MPLMVIRNIQHGKLCNGTCVILREVKHHLIKCEIAVGDSKGETVYIPHVGLEPSSSDSNGLLFKRTQFPVKPAFAMTVNKAQGQSLLCVGLTFGTLSLLMASSMLPCPEQVLWQAFT